MKTHSLHSIHHTSTVTVLYRFLEDHRRAFLRRIAGFLRPISDLAVDQSLCARARAAQHTHLTPLVGLTPPKLHWKGRLSAIQSTHRTLGGGGSTRRTTLQELQQGRTWFLLKTFPHTEDLGRRLGHTEEGSMDLSATQHGITWPPVTLNVFMFGPSCYCTRMLSLNRGPQPQDHSLVLISCHLYHCTPETFGYFPATVPLTLDTHTRESVLSPALTTLPRTHLHWDRRHCTPWAGLWLIPLTHTTYTTTPL